EIRTHDLLYPKQARYQATLRPDKGGENADRRGQKQSPISLDGQTRIRVPGQSPRRLLRVFRIANGRGWTRMAMGRARRPPAGLAGPVPGLSQERFRENFVGNFVANFVEIPAFHP